MAQAQEVFLFNPTSISGCQLWLDAADPTTLSLSGSTVTQWNDKSGNGRNATGSLSPTLVQGIQNKLPAIYFNGASYMTGSLTNTTAQQSVFSVFRFNTGAPQYARLASFGVNGQFDYNNNAYYNLSYNTGTLAITRSPTETQVTLSPALDVFHQASILFNGTNGLYYTDGGAYSNSAAWTANFNFSQYRLGTDQIVYVPQQMIGYIAEVIVYSSGVTTSQREQVEGYLAWKWGLQGSLPSNHPFKTYRPLANIPIPTAVPPMPLATQGTIVFAPTQISGCSLWLDSADQTTLALSGNNVTQWNDKSGNRYSVSQPTLANQPTRISQTSGIRFEGQTYLSQTSGNVPILRDLTTMTILCVAANTANVSYNNILTFWYKDAAVTFSTTPKFNLYTSFGNTNTVMLQCAVGAGSSTVTNPIALTNNTATIVGCSASPSAITANYNGNISSTSGLTLQIASADTLMTIGYPGYESNLIYEIILYNSSLSTPQRQQVEGYLAWKWGLTASLPDGHPYKRPPIAPFSFSVTPYRGGLNQWQPRQVSGCRLWLDAADRSGVSLSGSTILNVIDKSGQGVTFTTAAGFTYTPNTLNGLSVFSGSAAATCTLGSNTSFTMAQPFSAFYVGNYDSAIGTAFVFDEPSASRVSISMQLGGTYQLGTINNFLTGSSTPFVGNHFTSVVYNSTNSSIRLNGASFRTGNMGTPGFTGTIVIGSRFSAVSPWRPFLGELLLYNSALTTAQQQQVEGYLAWKWGLVGNLPANHPFKKWPPPP